MRVWMGLAAAALTIPLLAGCDKQDGNGADQPIRIAVAGPISGSAAAAGEMMVMAAKLAAEEVNAAGGIRGRKVELQFEDDAGKGTEAANIARKVANDESICMVIGHFNSVCSNAAKATYNRKGIVQFSPASTNVDVCRGHPWTFRNLYRDDYQGTFLARYAKKVLGARKAAVIFENDDYGRGLMEAFRKEAGKIGLEIVHEPISYLREQTPDFKSLVQPLKGLDIDVVFISGLYNEPAMITKALRQDLNMNVPILGGDGLMNDTFIEIAGSAAEGVYVTTPFLFELAKDNPKARAFFESFREKYNRDPDTWAALTYDALQMAFRAIQEVGPDRAKIREWFASITTPQKAYEGVTGPTYFDKEGDCYSKGAHVAVVRNGKFVAAEKQLKLED